MTDIQPGDLIVWTDPWGTPWWGWAVSPVEYDDYLGYPAIRTSLSQELLPARDVELFKKHKRRKRYSTVRAEKAA